MNSLYVFIFMSDVLCKYVTIIGQNTVICQWRADQINDLRDTDKSQYFAIPEFNNCFIIQSPSLFSYFNHFLEAEGSSLPFFFQEPGSNYA